MSCFIIKFLHNIIPNGGFHTPLVVQRQAQDTLICIIGVNFIQKKL